MEPHPSLSKVYSLSEEYQRSHAHTIIYVAFFTRLSDSLHRFTEKHLFSPFCIPFRAKLWSVYIIYSNLSTVFEILVGDMPGSPKNAGIALWKRQLCTGFVWPVEYQSTDTPRSLFWNLFFGVTTISPVHGSCKVNWLFIGFEIVTVIYYNNFLVFMGISLILWR